MSINQSNVKELTPSSSSADISNLQENFSKQQKKISALKELVSHGKSTSSAQEKVKNIAQRLTLLKSKTRARPSSDPPQPSESPPQHQLVALNLERKTELFADPTMSLPAAVQLEQHSDLVRPAPVDGSRAGAVYNAPGSEKILLLRQQMEQNRALMAQRASSKQHLEQLVTQLREKFDTTKQCLDDTNELGKSMTNLSALATYTPVAATRERHKSATDLSSQTFSLERERIKFLENRLRLLEKQLEKERQSNNTAAGGKDDAEHSAKRFAELTQKVLALEEALELSEARTEESSLLHSTTDVERLRQMAEKNEQLLNEIALKDEEIQNLREQQQSSNSSQHREANPETNEMERKSIEIERLESEIEAKAKRIADLEAMNHVLETTRCDLTMKLNETEERLLKLSDQLSAADEQLRRARDELQQTADKCSALQESLSKQKHLEADDATTTTTRTSTRDDRNTDRQVHAEMAKQIQELQDELRELRSENGRLQATVRENAKLEVSDTAIGEKIASLEATIESQRTDMQVRAEAAQRQEEALMEKTTELNVLNANFAVLEERLQQSAGRSKPLLSSSIGAASGSGSANNDDDGIDASRAEIQQLKQKLDEANKAMIKLKLKCKQAEKQVARLQKGAAAVAEPKSRIAAQAEDAEQPAPAVGDEADPAALIEDQRYETQAETVRLLQLQKYEQTEKLEAVQQELDELRERLRREEDNSETARVKSEMSEIHLEERVEEQSLELYALQRRLATSEAEVTELQGQLDAAATEKQVLAKKLEHYINENIELLDKVEKLSKSSSSAESIEIVERLTQQERAEIERLHSGSDADAGSMPHHSADSGALAAAPAAATTAASEATQTAAAEMGAELSESLLQLREESSELMNKIELFTTERREVLEKMEHLGADNQELQQQVAALSEEKQQLEARLRDFGTERERLAGQVAESTAQSAQLSQELTSLQRSSEVVAALDSRDGAGLFDKCEQSLGKLNSELEAYRRANDKNAKFNASKKLAKEAKNAHAQLSELLQKVKEASSAVETVTVVETVVAVTAPNGKALAEYEQLTAQNRALKATVDDLRRELLARQDNATSEALSAPAAIVGGGGEDEGAVGADRAKLLDALGAVERYEVTMAELQSSAEELRRQLRESLQAGDEQTAQIALLQRQAEDFDRLLNDKEMSLEQYIAQSTRLRRDLEGKCETYEGEMEILQTLVAEQKQQLIEAYQESEHALNTKLLEQQEWDELKTRLRREVEQLSAQVAGGQAQDGALQLECEQLRESLRINKTLVGEQLNELANKQDTIDTLNQQLIDLYSTAEANANSIAAKEDETTALRAQLERNADENEALRKDNDEQKSVVDKLLSELHSHRAINLEQRNRDQLEKLKKYAANLKKRSAQCQEYETKLQALEKGAQEAQQSKERADDELASLNELSARLSERSAELERQCADSRAACDELQQALQTKTMETLLAMESGRRLERELQEARAAGQQKLQEIVQLQNALAAASQDHHQPAEELPQLAAQAATIARLEDDLKHAEENLAMKVREIALVRGELMAAQEQAAATMIDWGGDNDAAQRLEQAQAELMTLREQQTERAAMQQEQEMRYAELTEELHAKTLKFEKSKAVIKDRNNQIHRLQAQLKDLQAKLSAQPEEAAAEDKALAQEAIVAPIVAAAELGAAVAVAVVPQADYEALQRAHAQLMEDTAAERAVSQATLSRLETLHDGIKAKLQENMSYIESLELENGNFKEKICKLVECVATFEERRASMERRAHLLDEQLQTRADEHERSEDALVYRLNMLSEHDEVIGRRLLETQEEKEDLQERCDRVQRAHNELSARYATLEKEHQAYRVDVTSAAENEKQALRDQLAAAEAELQRARTNADARLAAKATEIDELECELSDQLDKMNAEKRTLLGDLERARDECNDEKDEIVRLKESLSGAEQARQELEREATWLRMQNDSTQQDQYELQELRMQTLQDKTEQDNLRHQIETLAANHDIELQALRRQIAELDTLRMQVGQNQTDDQVFIETENKRLTELLAERDAAIDSYQRQNLQMAAAAATATQEAFSSLPPWRDPVGEAPSVASGEIPAAASFFAVDQSAQSASPFDQIVVQARSVEPLGGSAHSRPQQQHEGQRTIEDLQRNVSDLEKHAHDLENKLAARQQSEADLQQLRERVAQLEALLGAREQELSALQRTLDTERQSRMEQATVSDVESQIVPDASAGALHIGGGAGSDLPPVQIQPTLDMFFGGASAASAPEFESLFLPADEPVVEPLIVPKKAYVCHPTEALDLGSDDWGDSWGGLDGAAEEAHFSKTLAGGRVESLVPRDQQLALQLQDERERAEENLAMKVREIALVRGELMAAEAEKQEAQLKSSKLLKKLKEYKLKLDELQATGSPRAFAKSASVESNSNSMFGDLDATIQEELKAQIGRLEARLIEQQKAHESLALEKEKLLKRVDVLGDGNDRMAELKERQDRDVQMYQARIRELQEQLSRLDDWGTAAADEGGTPVAVAQSEQHPTEATTQPAATPADAELQAARIAEITRELQDDKQELQAQLEEERANVLRADEAVRALQQKLAARDNLATQSETAERERCAELQAQLVELQAQLVEHQKATQLEAVELERLRACEAQLRADLAAKTDEWAAVQSAANAEADERESQLLQLRMELEAVEQANRELKEAVASQPAQRIGDDSSEQQLRAERVELERCINALQMELRQQRSPDARADELAAQMLEKESEILHLKQRVEDLMREDQTEKLVLEILTKNQEIHLLKMQVKHLEDDKLEMEHNLSLQITQELQAASSQLAAPSDQAAAEQAAAEQQQRVEASELEVRKLRAEKANMEEELMVLNAHVLSTLQQEDQLRAAALDLDAKTIEIGELRATLDTLRTGGGEPATAAPQLDVAALNAQWEALVEQRCGEIAQMWREHLEQRQREFATIEARLHEQIAALQGARSNDGADGTEAAAPTQQALPPPLLKGISAETTTSPSPLSASTSPSASSSAVASKDATPLRVRYVRSGGQQPDDEDEDGVQDADMMIERMHAALECQEMEIVTLKEQLAIRSAEYARLAAQYDPFKLQATSSHRGMLSGSGGGPISLDSPQARRNNASPSDGTVVPKSEFDLALYMLHQRDMRCEEMTVELVQLLEERDTLQLKLSNTLRQLETVRSQAGYADPATSNPADAASDSSTDQQASARDSANDLTQKLSQLQTVDHSKDKIIKEDRDQRSRQMEKMQQDVAKMPTAAVSELVGTDFSQSNQSPSSVLLNWLLGNNQPTNPNPGGNAAVMPHNWE